MAAAYSYHRIPGEEGEEGEEGPDEGHEVPRNTVLGKKVLGTPGEECPWQKKVLGKMEQGPKEHIPEEEGSGEESYAACPARPCPDDPSWSSRRSCPPPSSPLSLGPRAKNALGNKGNKSQEGLSREDPGEEGPEEEGHPFSSS